MILIQGKNWSFSVPLSIAHTHTHTGRIQCEQCLTPWEESNFEISGIKRGISYFFVTFFSIQQKISNIPPHMGSAKLGGFVANLFSPFSDTHVFLSQKRNNYATHFDITSHILHIISYCINILLFVLISTADMACMIGPDARSIRVPII